MVEASDNISNSEGQQADDEQAVAFRDAAAPGCRRPFIDGGPLAGSG